MALTYDPTMYANALAPIGRDIAAMMVSALQNKQDREERLAERREAKAWRETQAKTEAQKYADALKAQRIEWALKGMEPARGPSTSVTQTLPYAPTEAVNALNGTSVKDFTFQSPQQAPTVAQYPTYGAEFIPGHTGAMPRVASRVVQPSNIADMISRSQSVANGIPDPTRPPAPTFAITSTRGPGMLARPPEAPVPAIRDIAYVRALNPTQQATIQTEVPGSYLDAEQGRAYEAYVRNTEAQRQARKDEIAERGKWDLSQEAARIAGRKEVQAERDARAMERTRMMRSSIGALKYLPDVEAALRRLESRREMQLEDEGVVDPSLDALINDTKARILELRKEAMPQGDIIKPILRPGDGAAPAEDASAMPPNALNYMRQAAQNQTIDWEKLVK